MNASVVEDASGEFEAARTMLRTFAWTVFPRTFRKKGRGGRVV